MDYYVATRNGTFVANCYVGNLNLHNHLHILMLLPGLFLNSIVANDCIDFTRWIIDKRNINSCLYLFILPRSVFHHHFQPSSSPLDGQTDSIQSEEILLRWDLQLPCRRWDDFDRVPLSLSLCLWSTPNENVKRSQTAVCVISFPFLC